jgi:hypothetical protein
MIARYLKLSFLCCIMGLSPLFMHAQHLTGLSDEDMGYDTTSTVLLPSSKDDLPRSINLKAYCPMPGNQGQITSCVGWSVGYGLLTIENAIKNKRTETRLITEQAYSALFVYNQIRGAETTCLSRATITDALDLLKAKGNCFAREFDFKVEDCYTKPDAPLKEKALKHTISDYQRLFSQNTEGSQKVESLRQLLAQNKPIAVGMKINAQFLTLNQTDYWNPSLGKEPTDGHAMVVVGYDDDAACFTLFNSWGKIWGRDGFIKIRYRDMAAYCRYGFVIHLAQNNTKKQGITMTDAGFEKTPVHQGLAFTNPVQTPPSVSDTPKNAEIVQTTTSPKQTESVSNPQKPLKTIEENDSNDEKVGNQTPRDLVELSGSFDINYFTGRWTDTKEPIFEELGVSQVGTHYVLSKQDWRIGDAFQLALTSKIGGAYVYIISVNPRNEVKIMFPRHEEFGQQYKGLYESPLLLLDGARAILPNPNKVIKVDYTGTDRVCILFSTHKIWGFPKFCQKIQQWTGNFDSYLQQLLGNLMIPTSDTEFSPDKVSFTTATRSEGAIVPIIIEFHSK